jgi:chromosome segregation ATPase
LSVAALQRKILDVGGPKLSRAQAKVDILSKQFDTQSAALSTKEVEEANLRKCATKAAAAKAKCDEDYKKTQEKLNNLLKEQEEMENDAVKVNTVIQSAKERMTEQEVLLKRITQEFNDLKQTVEKVKASEVDLSEEIKTASRLLKESNQRLDQHRKHLEVLRKTHVDEQKEFNSAVRDILRTKRPVTGTTTEDVAFDEMIVDMPIEELSVMTPEELETALVDPSRKDDLSGRINLLEEERDKMKGNVNMNALMEYLRKDAGYRARLNELEKITEV